MSEAIEYPLDDIRSIDRWPDSKKYNLVKYWVDRGKSMKDLAIFLKSNGLYEGLDIDRIVVGLRQWTKYRPDHKEGNGESNITQSSLIDYMDPRDKASFRVFMLTPSCKNCTRRRCSIDDSLQKIKCLKKRAYLLSIGARTFNINTEDPLFKRAIREFWTDIKRKEVKEMFSNERRS